MNSHEVFIHIHQGCFAGTGAIVRLPRCQWSKPDGYGKISQCITTTKHSKAKTVCIFLGIYCIRIHNVRSLDRFHTIHSSSPIITEMCTHTWCQVTRQVSHDPHHGMFEFTRAIFFVEMAFLLVWFSMRVTNYIWLLLAAAFIIHYRHIFHLYAIVHTRWS